MRKQARLAKSRHPLRIAVVNDDEIIVESLAQMFVPFASRVSVVEAAIRRGAEGGAFAQQVPETTQVTQVTLEDVSSPEPGHAAGSENEPTSEAHDWPGHEEGLTQRESDIIVRITRGLSNQDIADTIYLSINSVKGYIRSSYQKMNVTSRTQAVLWGIDHGLRPERIHLIDRPSADPGQPPGRRPDLSQIELVAH